MKCKMMHDMLEAKKTVQKFFFIEGPIEATFVNIVTYQSLKLYMIIPFLTAKPRDKLIKF